MRAFQAWNKHSLGGPRRRRNKSTPYQSTHDSFRLYAIPNHHAEGNAMEWDAIAAVGQAVSALALVLVLVQVRQAREEARHAAGQARLMGSREMFLATATNHQLADALARLWT